MGEKRERERMRQKQPPRTQRAPTQHMKASNPLSQVFAPSPPPPSSSSCYSQGTSSSIAPPLKTPSAHFFLSVGRSSPSSPLDRGKKAQPEEKAASSPSPSFSLCLSLIARRKLGVSGGCGGGGGGGRKRRERERERMEEEEKVADVGPRQRRRGEQTLSFLLLLHSKAFGREGEGEEGSGRRWGNSDG